MKNCINGVFVEVEDAEIVEDQDYEEPSTLDDVIEALNLLTSIVLGGDE